MNEVRFTLTENARLAPNVYRLRLAGDASAITAPGFEQSGNSLQCESVNNFK